MAGLAAGGYALAEIDLPPERFQAQTTFLCTDEVQVDCNQDNAMARLFGEQDRVNVALDQVPDVMVEAVIAAEDRDFFTHQGVDPVGIARAAWQDVRGGNTQGGSTITQQYVKNVYLTNEQTITRKVREAVLAVRLEQELSKEEILERYLNTIYFGRGAYGIGTAARTYFGTDVSGLTLAQSAYLAGLIRAPEAADATRDPEEASRRRLTVLDAMLEERYITRAEHDEADALGWVELAPDGSNTAQATILSRSEREGVGQVRSRELGTDYLIPFVLQELSAMGFEPAEVYGGGLRVYTSLDMDAQRAAVEAVQGNLDRPEDPPAALVAIDELGFVRAMVGGDDFANDQVNRALGARGGGTGRQPGSTMKPFVLATAVRQGISLQSRYDSPGRMVFPGADAGADYTVSNYSGTEQGVLDLTDATRVSSNTAYVQLLEDVGPQATVDLLAEVGIADAPAVLSLVLGVNDVSPYDWAAAYATFARGGTWVEPTLVTRVELPDGRVVVPPQDRRQVLTPEQNDQVVHAMRQVIDRGTGTAARFGEPAAGKTGTTQDNRDAWFAGFTPNGMTAVVWMGYDPVDSDGDGVPDQTRFMDDVHGRSVTGGSFPAEIWNDFMDAWTEGVDVGSFPSITSFPGDVRGSELSTTTSSRPVCGPGEDPDADGCRVTTTTSATTAETLPETTETTDTTAPPTTGPPTTAPPSTAPPTTAPPTTAPPPTVPVPDSG